MRRCELQQEEIKQLQMKITELQIKSQAYEICCNQIGHTTICSCHEEESHLILILLNKMDYVGDSIAYTFKAFKCDRKESTCQGHLFACEQGKNLFIEDIQVYSKGGIGSLLLEELIKFANINHYNSIIGELAEVDLQDHQERLLHFYNKFGFQCDLKKNRIYKAL